MTPEEVIADVEARYENVKAIKGENMMNAMRVYMHMRQLVKLTGQLARQAEVPMADQMAIAEMYAEVSADIISILKLTPEEAEEARLLAKNLDESLTSNLDIMFQKGKH